MKEYVMEYLKTLSISELIAYLELESEPANFTKVKKILSSREKEKTTHAKELGKDLAMYRANYSAVYTELEEEKKKSTELKGELEGFMKYKMKCDNLQEKVTHLEEECRSISEREKRANENITKLSADLQKVDRNRDRELIELQTKIKDLECAQRIAGAEIEAQKKTHTDLEKRMKHANKLEKDLEMYKASVSKLSTALEEKSFVLEGKLEELKGHKMTCEQLKETVTRLEEDLKNVSEREKRAVENITNLAAAFEKTSRNKDEELIEVKTKNKDLECAKRKAEEEIEAQNKRYAVLEKMVEHTNQLEKDVEVYKVKYSDLSTAFEKKKEESIVLENKLGEFEEYKMFCEELKQKVAHLEGDYKIVSEQQMNATERITNLLIDIEKLNRKTNKELNELTTKNKDLEHAKQKAEDEIKIAGEREKSAIERITNLSIDLEKLKQERNGELNELNELKTKNKDLECVKQKAEAEIKFVSEREKSAVERITNLSTDLEKINGEGIDELNQLKRKNKDLECDKQKADDELKVQKNRFKQLETVVAKFRNETATLICWSHVSERANLEVRTELSNKKAKKDKSKQGKIQSETNGGVNGACSSKLKIKLKPLSCAYDEVVHGSAMTDSNCHAVKSSGDEQAKVVKRKRTRKIVKGGDDDQIRNCKQKVEPIKTNASGVHHHSDSSFIQSQKECEENELRSEGIPLKYSGNLIAENAKESAKSAERQSKRNSHPPHRLNL